MFERFTDRARRVVVQAQDEARRLDHDYIGSEHLLLGLIKDGEGVAAVALSELGINLDVVRQKVEEAIGRGEAPPSGHIPFTPQAKKVLELSLREALQIGHSYIGTEHLLLALMREGEGVGAQVLTALGADLGATRRKVIQLLHGYHSGEVISGAWLRGPGRPSEISDKLDAITRRLSSIEIRLGIEEPAELRRLDEQIARAVRDKEEAIDAQDFKRASELRDQERTLRSARAAEEQNWRAASPRPAGTPGLEIPESAYLAREVERLTELLRQHGIDPATGPPGDTPPPAAESGA